MLLSVSHEHGEYIERMILLGRRRKAKRLENPVFQFVAYHIACKGSIFFKHKATEAQSF